MALLAPDMDLVGFHSMEVWGGATFDVCIRFLHEDPWTRLENLRRLLPYTRLQMLLRGQNLVGYRNYPDDVVTTFIRETAACGIDIFRIFDALNDERNMETSIRIVKECGKHAQGTVCYSLTQTRMGGDVYTLAYYRDKARRLRDMGVDSLCIKDMAGLLSPWDADELVRTLKDEVSMPVQLHCHETGGLASMSYLKAIEAGVDVVDTALAPLASRSSQPACESLVVSLQGTARDPGLDMQRIFDLSERLGSMMAGYEEFTPPGKGAVDIRVLKHQVPGGMISNLVHQLEDAKAIHRLPEVLDEIPRTRKDLGSPPLVTPSSQIVGVQAVLNVLFGRYKVFTQQTKDYLFGLYGRSPLPVDPDVRVAALRGYPRGEQPIECRPADVLEPELEKARETLGGLARTTRDVLTYALYPQEGLNFLERKYGREEMSHGR